MGNEASTDDSGGVSREWVDARMVEVEASLRRQIEGYAKTLGLKFHRMVTSFRAAARYARHRDPQVRDAALFVMNIKWSANRGTDVAYARAGLGDPEPAIRRRALGWLGLRNSRSLDPNVSTVLAWAVMDPKNSVETRIIAYAAFCMVRDIKVPAAVEKAIETPEDALPPEVDLTLVRVFAAL